MTNRNSSQPADGGQTEVEEKTGAATSAGALSADVWRDMQTERPQAPQRLNPEPPDGVIVIHPWDNMRYQQALKDGRVVADDQGKRTILPDADEPPQETPQTAQAASSREPLSTAYVTRREDGSLESVSISSKRNNEKHEFAFAPNGNVESVVVTGADGTPRTIKFDAQGKAIGGGSESVSTYRSADGTMLSFSFNDGKKAITHRFDEATNEIGTIETREGNRQVESTIGEGWESSSKEKIFNDAGEVVEQYDRSDEEYSASKLYEDRRETVSINNLGTVRTVQEFTNGRTIENIQATNGDYTFKQREPDGSEFMRRQLRGHYTVQYTDPDGNWIKQDLDQKTGVTTQTHGNSRGEIFSEQEMRKA